MKAHTVFFGVRMSSALRDMLKNAGESSAAARALLIIGAATSGLDLVDVREEIPDLLSSCRLRPEVRAQLLLLIASGSERLRIGSMIEPMEDDFFTDDELLLGDADGAGFDV